ncbi:iron(III) transport system permease protein [Sphaerotilus hippei]|uniref:Iron(III) transport system permease protein n=1 Tax=Sphaerotilus hippei TaxID=744406 RepID=A0A318H9T7_9BURK|nr:putative 2-aminoethylphosphonate ABC transporter permease subunit [Sphaerotilus hippei]PXW95210.1 iron(III) transport system permease protein [Sphaerotilus hippei]
MSSSLTSGAGWAARPSRSERGSSALLLAAAALLCLFLLLPMGALFSHSLIDAQGRWQLTQFRAFASAPGTATAIWNTLWVALVVTGITVPLAFVYAYAIQRSCMPFKALWRLLGLSPLLGPSLVGAIAFIQWFGTQGVLKPWLGDASVYGPLGIVMATVFASFPHALMILIVALATSDGRLYEAADALRATRWRRFLTVTLPSAKYGLISAAMVVFSYSVSEFGIPKVIGGNFQVLAVEIYVQAVGQQNFGRGAVVAMVLLMPVLLAFAVDLKVQRRQQASLTSRAVPYVPKPDGRRDTPLLICTVLVAGAMVAVLGMAAATSFISFWPYNLAPTLDHYAYGLAEAGVLSAYLHSLWMALLTALTGTPFVFVTAYLLEKTGRRGSWLHTAVQALASLPMGVPGLVLGIGYILFFNQPGHPLGGLYQSFTILVIVNVVHHYTSCHLTALTALKSLDREFEAVSASLKVPRWVTFRRVTLPVCLPAVLDISRYLFINAMTTVSALVFLYAPHTLPASVAILNLDEAGELGPAAAMATLIVVTTATFSLLHAGLAHLLLRRHQAWRQPHR